jgi:hypothetical protein
VRRRKPVVETVPAASLVEDFDLYPRHDVDGGHVADLARALRAGAVLPPVVADRASRRLADGWHRRRAAIRVGGPEATVQVEWQDYPDAAAIFADAVARNAIHGRKLDRQDQIRVAVLAERFGITTEQIGSLLRIEAARVLELRPRVVFEEGQDLPVAAKPVAEPFYGRHLTTEQVEAMKSFSGLRLSQQVSQVQGAVASGLVDLTDARLCRALHRLAATIREVIPVPDEPAA